MPLEMIHTRAESVLREFCSDHGLSFDACLLQSTFRGKQWWGDRRSKRFLRGIQPAWNPRNWAGQLWPTDLLVLEFLLAKRLARYGYPPDIRPRWFHWVVVPFLIWLPMKYEWLLARTELKRCHLFGEWVRTWVDVLFSYGVRVHLFLRYYRRRLLRQDTVAPHYSGLQTSSSESRLAPAGLQWAVRGQSCA